MTKEEKVLVKKLIEKTKNGEIVWTTGAKQSYWLGKHDYPYKTHLDGLYLSLSWSHFESYAILIIKNGQGEIELRSQFGLIPKLLNIVHKPYLQKMQEKEKREAQENKNRILGKLAKAL